MDERGFITRMAYDIPTGAMIQRVDDVDTSLFSDTPSGWTTPSGGGLNLVTDMQIDSQGRTIQALGPSHTIDLAGTATTIRTASWTVYDDENHITYSGNGYATGTSPSYTYTLVNPVSITKMDASGRVNEQIQAASSSTSGSLAAIITAAGSGPTAFPQSSYTRWTTNQYTDCCLAASQRVYHTIPATGTGSSGTNYDETDYGYDAMKRRNRTVSPGGTITDVVYDARGNIIGTYIGTNDAGATETDPTGGGSNPANNMVIVTSAQYDGGTAGGDGNLTQQTQFVDSTTTRVTSMTYDFRDRKITTDGEIDYFEKLYYDNLNRVVKQERYNTTASGNLIMRSQTNYDDRNRVYQTIRFGVDPSSGTVGNSLTDNMWFDASGNAIKSLPAGSSLFTKTKFDSLGRAVIQFRGYDLDETTYADAFSVTDDVILEQSETTFDAANNTIQTTNRLRYHNAPDSQKGALQNPSSTPKARVTYPAAYPDGTNRIVATANYGTNGGSALSRSSTIPAASDTVLVMLTQFDSAGNVFQTIDPAGMVTQYAYDNAGRKVTQIDNFVSGGSSSSTSGDDCDPSDDTNRTTLYTFTPDGQQATLTAVNPRTTNQTTTWTYGTTLSTSAIASSQLLASLTYPDSTGGSDVVTYAYNRQGEKTTLTDQRGCVHTYEYDKLGRIIHDRVTSLGSGVDNAVLRLSTTYEVRGMVVTQTSWNNANVSSGDVVNQCQFAYNNFQQRTADYQEHGGAVNTTTTPRVQYGYADGSTNTIRATTMTYPNGRVLTYGYGTSGSIDDAASRIANLIDNDFSSTHLADYSFLGQGTFVVVNYTQPNVQYTLVSLTGTNDPDTGDIYTGLDLFGRVKDCRWYNTGASTDVVRLKYGYDRASDRLWRQDLVAQSLGKNFDELYSYDGLHRLKDMGRGGLVFSGPEPSALSPQLFSQCWSLDPTSNWSGFKESTTGSGWTTVQSRTANTVNEITGITNTTGSAWVTPAYDAAGNTTTIPQPANPTIAYTATYDAWNRMVKLVDVPTGKTVQQNVYDPRTFRTTRLDFTSGTLSETSHFCYTSDWQSVEERLGTTPDSAAPERQQVWGQRYVDDLAARDRSTNGEVSLNERLYGLQDANWNVVAMMNSDATAEERYLYSAFGSPTFLDASMSTTTTSTIDRSVLFSGQRFDELTGLHLFRNRWYHSITGKFTTRDLLLYADGSSLYTYVQSQPLQSVDPDGLESNGNEKSRSDKETDEEKCGRFNAELNQQPQPCCLPSSECIIIDKRTGVVLKIIVEPGTRDGGHDVTGIVGKQLPLCRPKRRIFRR